MLAECWNLYSSGSIGHLYKILNEESREQDTRASSIGAVRMMDTNKDNQVSTEELETHRKKGKAHE